MSASLIWPEAQSSRLEARRIDDDVELRRSPSHEVDPRDAGNLEKPRLQGVAGRLPQRRQIARLTRETDADDRKRRERQPEDRGRRRRGQRASDLRETPDHVELRLDHVDGPVEEDVDLRRPASGRGLHAGRARNVLHGLFDGPRDRRHHLVGRHHAVVHENHDARKIGPGKHRRWQLQRAVDASRAERRAHERGGDGVACRPASGGAGVSVQGS